MVHGSGPRILEIRTHGVSGTPARHILADAAGPADPRCVVSVPGPHAADRAFVRCVDAAGDPVSAPGDPDREVWAYHWGAMTSGGWRKALWALLIPFALINLAYTMLPGVPDRPDDGAAPDPARPARARPPHLARAVVHVLGLALTVLFTVQLGLVAIDLFAGQCLAQPRTDFGAECLTGLPLRDWLAADHRRAAVLSTGAVALLLMIGAVTTRFTDVDQHGVPDPVAAEPGTRAATDDLLDGEITAPLLRALHGLAVPTALALTVLSTANRPTPGWWTAAGVLIALAVATALLDVPYSAAATAALHAWTCNTAFRTAGVLLTVAAYAAVGVLGWRVLPGRLADPGVVGAGIGATVVLVLLACLALWLLLFAVMIPLVCADRSRWRPFPAPFRPWIRGWSPLVVAGGAVLLGAGFGAGLARVFALAAGGSKRPESPTALHLPAVYDQLSLLWGLVGAAVVFTALTGAALWLRSGWRPRHPVARALSFPTGARSAPPPAAALRRWRRRWWIAQANHRLPRVAGVLAALTVAFVVWVMTLYYTDPDWADPDRARPDWQAMAALNAGLRIFGTVVLIVFVGGLAWAIQRATSRPDGAGRTLGMLWDVAAFWPREGHPVVPPAYAPTVVSDIVAKVRDLRNDPRHRDTHLVLSGHSQGSLIMYIAAHQLTTGDRTERLSLLTYGSQLQWLYGRAFPRFIDFDRHLALLTGLDGRWINVVRFTDPVGGPVLSWEPRWHEGSPGSGLAPHPVATVLDRDAVGDPRRGTHRGWRERQPGVIVNADPRDAAGRTRVLRLGNERWLPDPPIDPEFAFDRGHSNYVREPAWPALIAELVDTPPPRTTPDE
ncbi:hypothetical protein [Gordonia iterans]